MQENVLHLFALPICGRGGFGVDYKIRGDCPRDNLDCERLLGICGQCGLVFLKVKKKIFKCYLYGNNVAEWRPRTPPRMFSHRFKPMVHIVHIVHIAF